MVGAMSGTSADGVDIAVCEVTGRGAAMALRLAKHHHLPYPAELRKGIFTIKADGYARLAVLAQLGRQVTLAYARAVNEALLAAGIDAGQVAAVAAHGQTLFHAPPNTIQWFDPPLLAHEVGCAVVSDFRRADCAAGGQGAPLVPFADFVLFRSPSVDRALVNLGGIANVTLLPAGGGAESLVAFDTGPANCICDHLMRTTHPDGPGVDIDGRIAAAGAVNAAVVDRVAMSEYFRKPPPKSTDGPEMIALFESAGGGALSLPAGLATACQITATTLVEALRRFAKRLPPEIIVSGGGARNPMMMGMIRKQLGGGTRVTETDAIGVPGEAKEAIAFALLGAATLDGEPSNVPSCTGARRAVVLGSVTPKP